ncbi:DMT family transporter [Xanthobacteraceae bacterium A53D]
MNPPSVMRGLVAMLIAMACFITNDTLLKVAVQDFPVGEVLAIRSVFAVAFLFALVIWQRELQFVRHVAARPVVVRSGLDAATTFAYVLGLAVLPIATSTTIYMAAPLITTALSVPLLGEKVGFKRWCAIAVGFSGAIIVTRPEPSAFDAMAILPLISAFCGATRDIGTRSISAMVPGSVVALSSAVLVGLVGLTFAAWETWTMPNTKMLLLAFSAATAFSIGNLLLIYAFRNAPISAISPLRYVLVPGAVFAGLVVFGDVPDAWVLVGTILVVGAGLYSIQSEARKGRAARRAVVAQSEPPLIGGGAPLAGAVTRAPQND